jgi:hypothetical protein
MILATWLYLNAWCVLSALSMAFSQYTCTVEKERNVFPKLGTCTTRSGVSWLFSGISLASHSYAPVALDMWIQANLYCRHMCTLWFTWPHMTPPSTNSLPQLTSCCSLHSSLRTACKVSTHLTRCILSNCHSTAGTPLCHKRAASKCRLRVLPSSATPSLSCPGVP